MRRILTALVVTVTLIGTSSTAQSQQSQPSGSLVQQLIVAADESLEGDATVAVLRAYDRGYDLLQIIEAVFESLLAADGAITDEDRVAVAPTQKPAGLIAGDGAAAGTGGPVGGRTRPSGPTSGEEIGLDALERGVQKASKRLNTKNDLAARADDYDTSLDIVTMLTVIVLIDEGYSPEQIIIDGFIENGISIDVQGVKIRDAKGKVLRPDGVEPSGADEEETAAVASLVDNLFDAISGEDPLAAADDSFKRQYTLTIEVDITGDEGMSGSIEAKANIGARKGEKGALSGRGTGTFTANGSCSLSQFDTTKYPYTLSAPLRIGVSGRDSDGKATLNIGFAATSSVKVDAGQSFCLGVVRDTADVSLQVISIPNVTVRLRDGAQGNADNQDAGQPFTVGIAVQVKEI